MSVSSASSAGTPGHTTPAPGGTGASGGALPRAEEVVANLPWKWRTQGAIFLIGGLGFMFDAWDVALNGFLIPLLSDEWGLSVGQAAWIATANLLGMALGAFVWGGIADKLGRRTAFSLTILVFSLFTVLGALSPNLAVFIVFRFIAGFGLGGCIPVDYALVGEFTPKKHRGRVLTAMDGWWPIGATLCAFVSAGIVGLGGNWRVAMLVMVLPALLVFAIRLGVPESPMWLAAKGRTEEADTVIRRLVERTGGTQTEWVHDTAPAAEVNRGIRDRLAGASGQLVAVWRHQPATTATAWLLFVSVMVLYYAALIWLPKILREQGMGDQAAFIATGQMTAIGILGVVVCALLVEYTGRKWMLGVSAVTAAAALVGFAIALGAGGAELNSGAVLSILAFGFLVQMAIPALYTYITELYPTALRGSGFGWASAASRVATGIAPIVFGSFLWPYFGLVTTFVATGALVVVAVVIMAFVTKETTGRALE
ncbi:MFS transporter [Brevibacterium litoralis]|uniref:MFS transporter n=1 Tax=Brevibacterium litoralis TaxID=3138935 RepID=UPI0032F06FB2